MMQKKSQKKSEKTNNKNISQKYVPKCKKGQAFQNITWPQLICKKCGQPIKDVTLAISDKVSREPLHFDCVLDFLKNSEELQKNEEIIYVGGGNFAIVWFENPSIRKQFKIKKLIEWEVEGKAQEWRQTLAKLGSST